MNGVELDHVCVQDYAHYADSGINWRVVEGYGALIANQAAHLPVTLDCIVTSIDHSGPHISVTTNKGTMTASIVIVTVPPSLLVDEAIRFRPALDDKRAAAAVLPLGIANKMLMTIDKADTLPIDGHVFGHTDRVGTGSYHLRPFGRPLIEGYFGGQLARDLETAGKDAFFAYAVEELIGLFGSDICRRLAPLVQTAWGQDPFSRGSYSYALPGHADARAALAAPVDSRLFFAGEACSPNGFSTAHGAYRTGLDAAEQALSSLKEATAA
jgi:monoamine oxidase